jgi:hypothetical protein
MRLMIPFLCACTLAWSCQNNKGHDHAAHQHGEHESPAANTDTIKGSPQRSAMANIGPVHVHLAYSSPGVRGRIIWGGLVPFGEVWVTGAHNATSIQFYDQVKIAGKVVPKGKYAFFTIPDTSEWTLILNRNWDQHLADEYDAKDDVLRLKVKPDTLSTVQERLLYKVLADNDQQGKIEMYWEKLKISLPVELK